MAAKKHNMFRSKARLAFNVQEAQQHDYIFFNNPVFVQGYALACAVGGAVDLQTAAVLALAGCMLIIPVRLLGELAVGRIKARLRMLFYVGVGAVLSVPMLIVIYRIFGVEAVLAGIFLPLLFIDGAVTWRAGESKREGARVVLRGALSSASLCHVKHSHKCLHILICGSLGEVLQHRFHGDIHLQLPNHVRKLPQNHVVLLVDSFQILDGLPHGIFYGITNI